MRHQSPIYKLCWGKRIGHVKMYIAVNVRSKKVVSLEATEEPAGDSKMF